MAAEFCPSEPRILKYTGELDKSGSSTPIPVEMYPCETFQIQVEFSEQDPHATKHASVLLVNGTSHHGNLFFVDGFTRATLPLPEEGRDSPWPGVLGTNGVITAVRMWSGIYTEYEVSFSVEIRLTPRAGFNTAGLTFEAATLVTNGEILRMTLTDNSQNERYRYRLRLAAGGALKLSGSITNVDHSFWANMWVYLYDENRQLVAVLAFVDAAPGSSRAFESSTFTNPSAQPARFYLEFFSTSTGRVNSTNIEVTADTVPEMTTRLLKIRAGLNESFLEPAEGVALPTTARVPLGSAVTFQAIDSMGALVPATFTLGVATLVPSVDKSALFPGLALHKYAAPALDQGLFQAVHLGSVTMTVTPSDISMAPGAVSVVVERPLSLGDDSGQLATDVIDTAHRTGVPPHFVRAHVDKESRGNRHAYRYEPIGPLGDLFWASRGPNNRDVEPSKFYRLATELDSRNQVLAQGLSLLDADREPRASLRIGCDSNGNGGSAIGFGPTDPTALNPRAWEIFRCNDTTQPGRQNWSRAVDDPAEAKRRAQLLRDDPFTAQTTIAASYGLLQVMYGKAIETGWKAADGSRNPSLLFDPPGAAARGEGSLVAGAGIVRLAVRRTRLVRASFPPAAPNALLRHFIPAWQKYNPGEDGYGQDVASRTALFIPRPRVPVFAP